MARWHSYYGSGKALTLSTTGLTVVWSGNEVPASRPGQSVVALHFIIQGQTGAANENTLAQLARIRVKANGTPIWDLIGPIATNTPPAFRSFLETFYPSNTAPAAAANQFTVPFYIPDARNEDEADTCAFPAYAVPSVELVFNTDTGAGQNIWMGWTFSDVVPVYYPIVIGNPMNIAASQTNATFGFREPGFLRGLGIALDGLARLKVVVDGKDRINILGRPVATGTSANAGNMVSELMAYHSPLTSGISGGGATNASGYAWYKFVGMQSAPPGNSGVEIDTNAQWDGIAQELTLYGLRPQPAAR